jgi:hypothetical protein
MSKLFATPAGRLTAVVLTLALCLVGVQAADASTTASKAPAAQKAPVAKNQAGKLTSRVVGETRNGRRVSGEFVPLKFSERNGKVVVRGLLQGVVHGKNGTNTRFAQLKTMRVKSINGTPARAGDRAAARATCGILSLVLAPLDLDVLGLQIHLDRVVLNIVAVSGAGNLLGNLLCAVTGLLDGAGGLGRLAALLNRILTALGLG